MAEHLIGKEGMNERPPVNAAMGRGQKSFMLVRLCLQFLSGILVNGPMSIFPECHISYMCKLMISMIMR